MSQTKVEQHLIENNASTRRNIVHNGAMVVAQKGTTGNFTTDTDMPTDRWNTNINGAGTHDASLSTDVPTGEGFANSLRIQCTTAHGGIGSSGYFRLQQKIEEQYVVPTAYGTSGAKPMVMSFWIKFVNASGDFCVDILNLANSNNRVISKKFTYASGSGWQQYSFVIPGDTGGNSFRNGQTGTGIYWQIFLGAGSDLTSGTLQTTWDTRVNANRAAGQTLQFGSSTSDNVYLTGCQLTLGDTLMDFEHLPCDEDEQICFRYYFDSQYTNQAIDSTDYYLWSGDVTTSNTYYHSRDLPVSMRVAPTLSVTAQGQSRFTGTVNPDTGWSDRHKVAIASESNSTGARGYYGYKFIADAEL